MPPGLTFSGTLPVWPALTRAPDGTFSPPPKPSNCEPAEASFCLTTSSFATAVANGVTRTTATQVKSTCATVTGCNLPDVEETETVKACKLTRRNIDSSILAEATEVPEKRALRKRAEPNWSCEQPGWDYIIILKAPTSTSERKAVKDALDKRDVFLGEHDKPLGYHEVRSDKLGYTAFFFLNSVGPESYAFLSDFKDKVSEDSAQQELPKQSPSSANEDDVSSFNRSIMSSPIHRKSLSP